MGNNCSTCNTCGWIEDKEINTIIKYENKKGLIKNQNE